MERLNIPIIGPEPELSKPKSAPSAEEANLFEKMLTSVRGSMENADKASVQALVGDGQPHQAMLALTKADIAFRFMAQTRNKAIEAYQQIMNMQM